MYIRLTSLLSLTLGIVIAPARAHTISDDERDLTYKVVLAKIEECREASTDLALVAAKALSDFAGSIIPCGTSSIIVTYLNRSTDAARSEYLFMQAYDKARSSLAAYKAASPQESADREELARQVAYLNSCAQLHTKHKAALAEIEEYMTNQPDEYSPFLQLIELVRQRIVGEDSDAEADIALRLSKLSAVVAFFDYCSQHMKLLK